MILNPVNLIINLHCRSMCNESSGKAYTTGCSLRLAVREEESLIIKNAIIEKFKSHLVQNMEKILRENISKICTRECLIKEKIINLETRENKR